MYNNGNSSKNVTGASVVDGTLENADYADNGLSGDKIDGGIISNFQSTGIDDRLPTGKILTLSTTGIDVTGSVTCDTVHIDSGSGTILSAGSGADTTVISNGWTGGYGDWVKIEVPSGDDESGMIQLGSDGKTYFSGGIYLNGDTAAANALDDYEEGTWTPALYYQNQTGVTLSYITQSGWYTKVGGLVTLNYNLIVTIAGTPVADNIGIKGSPFTKTRGLWSNNALSIKNATGSGDDKTWLCTTIQPADGQIINSQGTGNQGANIGTGTNVTFRGSHTFYV